MPDIHVLHIRNTLENPRKLLEVRILDLARQGDNEGLAKVYDEYFDQVFRFFFYRTSHQETAEDLAEEVFVKVFQSLPRFRGNPTQLTGWIFRIARNLLIDHYRKSNPVGSMDELELLAADEVSVIDRLNLASEQQVLLKALAQLPAEQQTVLRMRFLEDASITEVAAVLGKQPGNVRIIQFRALKKLRVLLA